MSGKIKLGTDEVKDFRLGEEQIPCIYVGGEKIPNPAIQTESIYKDYTELNGKYFTLKQGAPIIKEDWETGKREWAGTLPKDAVIDLTKWEQGDPEEWDFGISLQMTGNDRGETGWHDGYDYILYKSTLTGTRCVDNYFQGFVGDLICVRRGPCTVTLTGPNDFSEVLQAGDGEINSVWMRLPYAGRYHAVLDEGRECMFEHYTGRSISITPSDQQPGTYVYCQYGDEDSGVVKVTFNNDWTSFTLKDIPLEEEE